ncbi:RES family NAD+ phosphorylase [Flavobacterium sp. AG291]|uniref:RES family NAD+ phosphorylase n=1 Tax=Flavobacterium sp. AG291 TaxID=2184000 RepID=UPI000E0C073B|nr:RES family NAD+ phosphorylase [Flavobacterium sp. AG291]RDI12150.1 RES domain-containing protein [Flavobacterium sp. AG291]
MIVFRLSKEVYANDLSGRGAEKAGGRWNSKGTAMLYTSESRALCTTEIAVHTPLGILPIDYVLIAIEIPNTVQITEIKPPALPENWKSLPHAHSTQEIGDAFVTQEKTAVLKVPSAVVQGEFNYLINPSHKDFKKIKVKLIEPFDFDERLFIR